MYYVGIDVGKAKLDIAFDQDNKIKHQVIENEENAILTLLEKLTALASDLHFILEATASYHYTLCYMLKERAIAFTILSPTVSSGYAQSLHTTVKTDKADAKMLLRYGKERQPAATQIPDKAWQCTRQIFAEWDFCQKQFRRESNHLEALKAWKGSSPVVIEHTEARIVLLETQLKTLEKSLLKDASFLEGTKEERKERVKLATSIKGIGKKTATALLFFTHDLAVFSDSKELAKFIGIVPVIRQSGKKHTKGRISKSGSNYLRCLLYNCVRAAVKHNPACKELFERLRSKGKPYKVAAIAVAHKLIRTFFAVMKSGKPYEKEFLKKANNIS